MATKSPGDGPTPKPTFVFKGAVRKLGAATMKNVPVDERVAIVRVEQVIEAPPNLARYGGQDITVQLGGRAKVAVGDELIFHTSGWIFGDSVAVRSLRQEPVKKTHAAMLAPGVDPVQQKHTREV